jgi:hypothetical protein
MGSSKTLTGFQVALERLGDDSTKQQTMKTHLARSLCFALAAVSLQFGADAGELGAGPETGGLCLRLGVAPRSEAGKEGFDVRLDLVSTSDREMTLKAASTYAQAGDLKDYLEAATSIECVPAIARWMGGFAVGRRDSPQPEYTLKPREVLSMRWQTEGRHLKNKVTNPNDVQNPKFPFAGLYSVHATLDVIASERTVRLRSNEQLVPVGGSRMMPKFTLGPLWHVDAESKTATLGLGSLHQVEVGDAFAIGSPKGVHWKLTITNLQPQYSTGQVEVLSRSNFPGLPLLPHPLAEANLIRERR